MRTYCFEVIAKTPLVLGKKLNFVAKTEVEDFVESQDAQFQLKKKLLKDTVFQHVDDLYFFLIPEERYAEYQKCEWMSYNNAREELLKGIEQRELARKMEDKRANKENMWNIVKYLAYICLYASFIINKEQGEISFLTIFFILLIVMCVVEIIICIRKIVFYFKKARKEKKKQLFLAK